MSSTRLLFSLLLTATLLHTACRHHTDDSPVVARVHDYELHLSDLHGLVSEGVCPEDSAAIVNNYIEQWIRQTVILTKAEKNINDNFERQLREYKNSLLTYAYEQQIVEQLLDTVVTEAQIGEYYEKHSDEFRLKSAIVKAVYVIAPAKSSALGKLRQIIGKGNFNESDIIELEATARRHDLTGYYDADNWMSFYALQNAVPITTYNEGLYLRQNRTIQLNDDSTAYLVRILDYKITDDIAPLETQSEQIRSIILNHRKIDILNRLQNDLLSEAEENGSVKRYLKP